ncbi:MAG TPA: hypothetical protein VND22_08750 [Actinomycetota bacterium]|nr:hypothetical protein [Actinomycetota bacterium]
MSENTQEFGTKLFRTLLIVSLVTALAVPAFAVSPSSIQDTPSTRDTTKEGICHPGPDDPDPMPDEVSHDHKDGAQHDFKCGLKLVDYESFETIVPEATLFGEFDVAGTIGAIAVTFENGGFVLVDLANPRDPQPLSRFMPPGCDQPDADCGTDVKLRPDAQVAFVSSQDVPGKGGIFTVNISDPRNPQLDHFLPIGEGGTHMLAYHEIGGQGYVFAIKNGFGISINKVESRRGKTVLTPVTEIPVGRSGQHDVFLYDDPVESKTFLYLSGEIVGWRIFDVTNPATPLQVGLWEPPIAKQNALWYAHNAWTWRSGEKRYTFVGPESVALVPFHGEIPTNVWLLDTTDHANIKLLGTWTNPSDRPGGNLGFSAHNIWMAEDGVFWMAHYHGGVWLLDWRDAMAGKSKTAKELGYMVPNQSKRQIISRADLGPFYSRLDFFRQPLIWDVVYKDGLAYAADMNGGLYVIERESPEELKKLETKRETQKGSDGLLILGGVLAATVLVILLIKLSAGKTGPGA